MLFVVPRKENLAETPGVLDATEALRKEYFALFSKSGFSPEMKKTAKKENVCLFHKNRLIIPYL